MTGRTRGILARLPSHFVATGSRELDQPGKLLEVVVAALARDLDELATDLAATRRSHRIGQADTIIDVLRLAALHGMDSAVFLPLWQRIDAVRAGALALGAGDATAQKAAADRLLALFAIDTDAAVPEDRALLSLWEPPSAGGSFDVTRAATRLALHAAESVRHRARLDLARERVTRLAAVHATGNGTIGALLAAAAAALDLELDLAHDREVKQALLDEHATSIHPDLVSDALLHSLDRYWHVSFVRDRFRLSRPVLVPPKAGDPPEPIDPRPLAQRDDLVTLDDPFDRIPLGELARQLSVPAAVVIAQAALLTPPVTLTPLSVILAADAARIAGRFGRQAVQVLPTARELLGLEENPLRREEAAPARLPHAGTFKVRRRGFGAAVLRIRVTGIGDFTRGPMVVNRDVGRGVGFVGKVPDGKILEWSEDGRVHLAGADVTSLAYGWRGACFADATALRPGHEFTFAEGPSVTDPRAARFAIVEPFGALDRDAMFPTGGVAVSVPPIGIGETRFAYFVRVSHFGGFDPTPPPGSAVTTTPWIWNAAFDATVFDDAAFPGPHDARPLSGEVALSWLEHEAYVVRIVIPSRFKALDEGAAPEHTVPAMVRAAVERVRPVGIEVRVEYLEEQWTLGDGRLPDAQIDDPLIRIMGGTVLWPGPPQPT
ncbi:MAG TPA: hypothetical protein VFT22_04700 [Kofleriaceae bacterium]|nr:hypothetical protein [Kofleriaceae bacterium]